MRLNKIPTTAVALFKMSDGKLISQTLEALKRYTREDPMGKDPDFSREFILGYSQRIRLGNDIEEMEPIGSPGFCAGYRMAMTDLSAPAS
jgi:hypothetical protein